MATYTKTLSFAQRQEIPESGNVVDLKFLAGDLRAEYLSGTEMKKAGLGPILS
jgi:hypothetical protein